MPWLIRRDSRCPVTRPFGVVLEADGSLEGCYASRGDAHDQQTALYAGEATKSLGFVPGALKVYNPAEHRDYHGRWTRGGLGKRLAEVTKGLPSAKPMQPHGDFNAVFDHAQQSKQAIREFLDLGGGLQKRLGATALVEDNLPKFERAAKQLSAHEHPVVVIPPLKQRASAKEKLQRKSYGAEGLTDLNRASVLVKGLSDIPTAVGELRKWVDENPGWSLHEVDNGFERKSGYRDLSVMLRSPNGHVSEIQFHINPMWEAKFRSGHALYEELRSLEALGRPLTATEKARYDDLLRQSDELYAAAMQAA